MSTKEAGGPAFPMIRDMRHDANWDHEPGMTLRDYFAAKAMQAHATAQWDRFYSMPKGDELGPFSIFDESEVAELAYEMADAMLKARAS